MGEERSGCVSDPSVTDGHATVQTTMNNRPSGIAWGQEAKRMGSALVSAGLVELALLTMT